MGERTIDTTWFQGLIKDKGYSQRGFARLIEMDHAALSLMLNGKRKMSVGEAGMLAQFLDKPAAEVLRRAGVVVRAGEHEPTPAPDTGRTAEEMREQVARFWWDRVCPTSYVGRWDEAKQHSGFFKQLVTETYEDADAILSGPLAQLQADLIAARKAIADHEAAAADKRRLARMIDVAMHGEAGAAPRPSLCDLVGPAEDLRRRAESAEKVMEMNATSGAFYARHAENATKRAEAAEAEVAQLRSRLLQAEKGAEAMRDVQEAVVARWREAAVLAVGGDLRRLQRLLNASQGRIVGSDYAAGDEPRCTATGNPCGTDTVLVGRQCPDNRWGGRCAHRIAEAAKLALLTQEAGNA